MMNRAIVLAGGDGELAKYELPRQFTNVFDKPLLVYTLEGFQRHPQIDEIGVVCISGWQQITRAYAKQFNITKLSWIVTGGRTSQESIYQGIIHLRAFAEPDDIIVIHDGIRPLIDESVLTNVLLTAGKQGNAVSALPYTEQLFLINPKDVLTTKEYVFRDSVMKVLTPQAYRFGDLLSAYEEALSKGIGMDSDSYTDTMMTDLGYSLHFTAGSEKNIKINSPDDLNLFKIYLHQEKDVWLK